MKCERCQGTGRLWVRYYYDAAGQRPIDSTPIPCPDCGGFGIVACCEGSQRHANLEEEE